MNNDDTLINIDDSFLFKRGLILLRNNEYSKAIECFQVSADNGNVEALHMLGLLYFKGHKTIIDSHKCLQYLNEAASLGNDQSLYFLGLIYSEGEIVQQDYDKALFFFKAAADLGNSEAMNDIGVMYFLGNGVEIDFNIAEKYFTEAAKLGNISATGNLPMLYRKQGNNKEALKYTKISAEQGNPKSQYNMGILYLNGKEMEQNIDEALKYLKASSNNGNPNAQYVLGKLYYDGDSVDTDYVEAAKYLEMAAEQGHTDSQYYLGHILIFIGDFYEACKRFIISAEKNKERAMESVRSIVEIFYEGDLLQRDIEFEATIIEKAIVLGSEKAAIALIEKYYGISIKNIDELLKDAAEGDPNSAFLASRFYLFGMCGVKKNLKKTIELLELASLKGHRHAQCELGTIYIDGMYGITQDFELGIKWLKKSADQKDPKGAFNYALCFATGKGVKKNYKEARKYYHISAEQDNAWAQYSLGRLYYDGHGVVKDYREAAKWLTKASLNNHADALTSLGMMYYEGKGVECDICKAIELLDKAATLKDIYALYNLGCIYYEGLGIDQDKERAKDYFIKAEQLGHPEAKHVLDNYF